MLTYSYERINKLCDKLHQQNNKIVFTNGCFDLFHYGHLDSLYNSSLLGNCLIVGINSDYSVRLFKNKTRPVFPEYQRAVIVHSLKFVKHVVIFNERVPIQLIGAIQPDVLVKGEEYSPKGLKEMITLTSRPCKIKTIKKVPEISTTSIIQRIQKCI